MPYKDPKKHRERNARYRAANREKIRERDVCHYAKNRAEILARKAGYYAANRALILGRKARYRATQRDKIRGYNTRYLAANREKCRESCARYRATHLNEERERGQRYRVSHRAEIRGYHARYRAANPSKVHKWGVRYRATHADDPGFRLNLNISRAIHKSLRGRKGGCPWEVLVSYTLADLMAHLQARFLPGMTWENIGQWHIDHIIPVSAFNFERAEDVDFKRCWALSNLQPLWESDNLSKGARLKAPFQPSLKLRIQGPKHTAHNA